MRLSGWTPTVVTTFGYSACSGAKFADIGIAGFEQPMPANRLSWYQRLRRQKILPILMDEPIVTIVDLEEFHRLGLLDGVAMKLSPCGGLEESCRILDYMEQHGLLFFASGLTDPDLSLAASLALFAAYQLEHPAALNAPQFLSGSLLKQPNSSNKPRPSPGPDRTGTRCGSG